MRKHVSHLWMLIVTAVFVAMLTPLAPASGVDSKPEPAKVRPGKWLNDPRSSAALNRIAAQNPAKAPKPLYAGGWTTQVLQTSVNNPAADATAQDTQSETSIAAIGSQVSIASNDSGSFIGGANQFTGYAFSGNNGLSFTDRGRLPASGEGDAGDPVMAADQLANAVYMVTLGMQSGENLQVFKSPDGGSTYAPPVNATPGFAGSGDFQDKPWMTVDNFPGPGQHNVYVCWTRFPAGGGADIRFTSSTDGGATFGPTQGTVLSPGGQGCYVVVAPDHSIYVFYYAGTGAGRQGGDNKIFVRRSTDFGATWAPEIQVADLLSTTVNGNLALAGGFRTNSFPHAAVNPANGNLYVTFNDVTGTADPSDVYYVKSTDSGATWSPKVQVNNDDASRAQFMPTVAAADLGKSIMFGYYSRATDGVLYHRRSRIGVVTLPAGTVSLKPSFQLGPDTPIVLGQDPVINSTYMGDYDQIVATPGFFHASWADNRNGNTFHAHQPDVRYARINATPVNTDPAVAITAPASASVGGNTHLTVTLTNSGANRAEDVFALVTLPTGLVPKAVVPSGGGKCFLLGQLVECSMTGLNVGTTKTIDITAFVSSAGSKVTKASITTSSLDTNAANNSASATTSASGTGVATTYSSGNIMVPIPDNGSTDVSIPVTDDGTVLGVIGRVRLDHTFDGDVTLLLISPVGTVVELSSRNGGSGDNYGSGANSCAGLRTAFSDTASTSITAGTAPFAGTFRPEQPQSAFAGENPQGGWTLRVIDSASADTGTVGCAQVTITRMP